MSHFTSRRERRLWIWTLVVIIAIYTTLGFAGTLAAYLRARNMLNNSFFAAFLIVVAVIAGSGLIQRPRWREILAALGILAVYVTMVFRLFVRAEERTHLFEYGLVAVLIYQALIERQRNGRPVPNPAVLTIRVYSQ